MASKCSPSGKSPLRCGLLRELTPNYGLMGKLAPKCNLVSKSTPKHAPKHVVFHKRAPKHILLTKSTPNHVSLVKSAPKPRPIACISPKTHPAGRICPLNKSRCLKLHHKNGQNWTLDKSDPPRHALLAKSTPKHSLWDKSTPKHSPWDISGPKAAARTWDMPSMSSWTSSAWLNCSRAIPTRKTISSPCGDGRHLSHPPVPEGFGVSPRNAPQGEHLPPSSCCRCLPVTSYMKMSKTRVATGRGKVVRKRVRNQDEAYMEVRKLCDRKWMFSSGSCSCGGEMGTKTGPGGPFQGSFVAFWHGRALREVPGDAPPEESWRVPGVPPGSLGDLHGRISFLSSISQASHLSPTSPGPRPPDPPSGSCHPERFGDRAYLQHVLKLVDAEPQLGHAGFEELPQAVLLHQPDEHAEGLLLGHLETRGDTNPPLDIPQQLQNGASCPQGMGRDALGASPG